MRWRSRSKCKGKLKPWKDLEIPLKYILNQLILKLKVLKCKWLTTQPETCSFILTVQQMEIVRVMREIMTQVAARSKKSRNAILRNLLEVINTRDLNQFSKKWSTQQPMSESFPQNSLIKSCSKIKTTKTVRGISLKKCNLEDANSVRKRIVTRRDKSAISSSRSYQIHLVTFASMWITRSWVAQLTKPDAPDCRMVYSSPSWQEALVARICTKP